MKIAVVFIQPDVSFCNTNLSVATKGLDKIVKTLNN